MIVDQVSQLWWARSDLDFVAGELSFAGSQVAELAKQFGTPLFLYSAQRVIANSNRIFKALQDAGFADRCNLFYAMKANRFAPLLTALKLNSRLGIDACSPNEVEHAISCGFRTAEISLTATNLSERDMDRMSLFRGLRINLDSLSAIHRWGQRNRGGTIGLRINPAIGVSRTGNDKLQYCRNDTTKFGIYAEQFAAAMHLCHQYNLQVETLHFHTGCGYLDEQLDAFDQVLTKAMEFVDQLDTIRKVNVGGGLGVPHLADDQPLNLARWATILAKHCGPRKLTVEVEPGDYLVKDAGLLLLTVNTVETRRSTQFIGVDGGFNIAPEPAVYSLPFEPVMVAPRPGEPQIVTIAGNINEALDLFYEEIELPPISEGDFLALINAGAYSTSMASNHCLRGEFTEVLLP